MRLNSAFADLMTAAALFAIGAGMAYGGYVMDRLEVRHIHPASFPGLVPIGLGVTLMFCSVLLASGTRRMHRPEKEAEQVSWLNFLVTAGWSCLYALVMVGRMPFAAATALYLAAFAIWFIRADKAANPPLRSTVMVALFSVLVALSIAAIFQYGFLVRLP